MCFFFLLLLPSVYSKTFYLQRRNIVLSKLPFNSKSGIKLKKINRWWLDMAKSCRLLKNNFNFTLRFTFWKYEGEWIAISIFNLLLLLLHSVVWDVPAQMSWWYIQITCSFGSYFNCISKRFLLQEKKEKKRKRQEHQRKKRGKIVFLCR